MRITDVKFRCSRLGDLMTKSRDAITEKQLETIDELVIKSRTKALTANQSAELDKLIAKRDAGPSLSDTATKYLAEVYVYYRYGRKKDITTKAIEKGLKVEEDSMTLYSLVKGLPFFKNERSFSNAWITGTPDNIDGMVRDLKSSWDIFTFTATTMEAINKKYEWQLRGYMELTDLDRASLAYCLIDTPDPMIQDAKRRLSWEMGLISQDSVDAAYVQACADIDKLMTYGDIPLKERLHEITIVRDHAKEIEMHEQINRARLYLLKTWPDFFTT